MIIKFLKIVESIPEEGAINSEVVRYCERFLEFTIDLEALLPTRRFFNTVLDDSHLLVRCFISPLNRRPEGKLFSQVSLFFIKYKSLFISLKLSWKWWDSYWVGDGMFGDNFNIHCGHSCMSIHRHNSIRCQMCVLRARYNSMLSSEESLHAFVELYKYKTLLALERHLSWCGCREDNHFSTMRV